MSEEELNQELSTDELKDVSGPMRGQRSDHIGDFKGNNIAEYQELSRLNMAISINTNTTIMNVDVMH